MIEDHIDFANVSMKILVNPIVPLQLLNIFCRTASRVQATILGKIYSSSIEILELIPTNLSEPDEIVKLDFQQHQRSLENIMNVYPALQILGCAVTDLNPDKSLATLHTVYSNKQSGFKPQGIINSPIILSVCTKLNPQSTNLDIKAYSLNRYYRICKELMEVVAFEEYPVEISIGDSDIQSMSPLFSALYDQQEMIPNLQGKEMIQLLINNLKQLKIQCISEQNIDLQIKVKQILDRIKTQQQFEMDELEYLLDYAGIQRYLLLKINKFQKQ